MRKVNNYLGVVLILVWGLAPFYWMVITALRDKRHTFDTTPWPTYVTLQNFREALSTAKGNDFINAIGNSLLIGLLTTVIAVAVGVFTAYALARMEFRGKGFVTGIVLGASMFPGIALVTPLFQLFGDLNWIGQYRALIIPNISFATADDLHVNVIFPPIAVGIRGGCPGRWCITRHRVSNCLTTACGTCALYDGHSVFHRHLE